MLNAPHCVRDTQALRVQLACRGRVLQRFVRSTRTNLAAHCTQRTQQTGRENECGQGMFLCDSVPHLHRYGAPRYPRTIHACVLASNTRLLPSNEVHLRALFLLIKSILLVTVAENFTPKMVVSNRSVGCVPLTSKSNTMAQSRTVQCGERDRGKQAALYATLAGPIVNIASHLLSLFTAVPLSI